MSYHVNILIRYFIGRCYLILVEALTAVANSKYNIFRLFAQELLEEHYLSHLAVMLLNAHDIS